MQKDLKQERFQRQVAEGKLQILRSRVETFYRDYEKV